MWFRPLPPLPDMEASEESVMKASEALQVWINPALSIAHDIAHGRNLKLFLEVECCWLQDTFSSTLPNINGLHTVSSGLVFQVAIGLWIVSYIGSLCNFLTLVYIGELLCCPSLWFLFIFNKCVLL